MMRCRISTLGSALALGSVLMWGIALAGTATAQPRVEERLGFAVTGEITALDAAARKITVKSTNDEGKVYAVDASATIMSGSQKLALGDLKKGWTVVMNGQDDPAGKRVTYIKVAKAP
jgi:hypothetical protein